MRAAFVRQSFALVTTIAVLGGCEAYVTRIQSLPVEPGATRVLNMNSDRRATYLVWHADPDNPGNSRHVVVAEPPPDTALQKTVEAIGKLQVTAVPGAGLGSATASGGVVDQSEILALTNRTQAVVILRDSLFRLAEARANGFIDKAEWIELYGKVLDSAKGIAEAEQNLLKASKVIQSAVEESKGQVAQVVETAAALKSTQASESQRATDRDKELAAIQQTIEQQLALLRTQVNAAATAALEVGGEREKLKIALASMQTKADQIASQLAESSKALAAKIESAASRVETRSGSSMAFDPSRPFFVLGNDASLAGQLSVLRAKRQVSTDSKEQKLLDDLIKDIEAKMKVTQP